MPTEDHLLELRADGDPVADELLQEAVKQSGRTAAEILACLRKPAADVPLWLQDLLDRWARQGPELPSWADAGMITAGQRFFDDYDLAICTALFTASCHRRMQGLRVSASLPACLNWPSQAL